MWRQNFILLLALWASAVSAFEVSPPEAKFRLVQYGDVSTTRLQFIPKISHDVRMNRWKIEGQDASDFEVLMPPGWDGSLGRGPVEFSISFKPLASKVSRATLVITVETEIVGEVDYSVELSGQGACLKADKHCDPPYPLCTTSSLDKHVQFSVPNYYENVKEQINDHFAQHNFRRDRDYELPIAFFWSIVGLSDLIQKPTLNCCSKAIIFHRDITMNRRAIFEWNGEPQKLQSETIPGIDTSIEVTLPKKISGIAYVFPGTSEFHYLQGEAPHLKIIWKGQLLFDGEVKCSNSSFTYATVRRFENSGSGLNMQVIEK